MTTAYEGGWAIDSALGPQFVLAEPSVPAGSFYLQGAAFHSDGSRYFVYAGDSGVPATAMKLGGIAYTQDGAMYVRSNPPTVGYRCGPFTCDEQGAVYVKQVGTGTTVYKGKLPFDEDDGGLISMYVDAAVWEFDASTLSLAPTIGSGTPTIVRAGATATRVNSSGLVETVAADTARFDYDPVTLGLRGLLVEEARTNLLLRSQEFDNASWGKTLVTITPDATTSPDGTSNADLATQVDVGDIANLTQTVTATADATYTASVFLKYSNNQWMDVRFRNGANVVSGWFDIQNGVVGSVANAGTASGATARITPYGNGWYRCQITGAVGSGATAISVDTFAATGDGLAGRDDDGAFYVWGAQFENSAAFATSYIPTTNATVTRNADLITLATSAIPGFSNATLTMFAEAYPGPDQTTNLARVFTLSDGTTAERAMILHRGDVDQIQVNVADGGVAQWGTTSFGIAVEGATYKAAIACAANNFAASLNGATPITDSSGTMPTVTTVGLGASESGVALSRTIRKLRLYNRRLSDTEIQAITEPTPIWEFDATTLSLTPTVGTGTPTVTRAGNTATRVNSSGYIEVVNANLPRFDYDPVTLALKGLLVEEVRTNLKTQSNGFSDASWSKQQVSVLAAQDVAPTGVTEAWKLTEDASLNSHILEPAGGFGAADNTIYTCSYFVKAAERTRVELRLITKAGTAITTQFNLSAGTVTSGGSNGRLTYYGNGWYRCEVTGDVLSGATTARCRITLLNAAGSTSYQGDGTSGVYVFGNQHEAGAFSTSYIPTAGATVTRNGDFISVSTSAIMDFSQATLTMYGEAYADSTSTSNVGCLILHDGTNAERHVLGRNALNTRGLTIDGNVTQVSLTPGSWAALAQGKLAYAIAANDFAASFDGGAVVTDTGGTLPTVTTLSLGLGASASAFWNSHIRSLKLYNVRKSDAQLQALTA